MNPPLNFARRVDWSLAANPITRDLVRLRESGARVIDLTESNPTRCGLAWPLERISHGLASGGNIYYQPDPRGNLQAREAVARYYQAKGVPAAAERIVLTSSTSEAYSFLFRLLADPGDAILFPRPSYPLFTFLGDLNDVAMETYPLKYDAGSWRIDVSALRRAVTASTKAVVVVNPNNPTGSFVKPQELDQLNAVCASNAAALISDEVFFDFVFDQGGPGVSLGHGAEVLTCVLGGISKTLGLPQMKLSWILLGGPDDVVTRAAQRLEVIADTYLSVNTPAQNALAGWLDAKQEIQTKIGDRVRANRRFLAEALSAHPSSTLLSAEGGWYAVVKIPDVKTEEDWVLGFLNQDHVFVHPGYFFDFDEEAYIVVSLLPEPSLFQEGIRKILARTARDG